MKCIRYFCIYKYNYSLTFYHIISYTKSLKIFNATIKYSKNVCFIYLTLCCLQNVELDDVNIEMSQKYTKILISLVSVMP